MGKQLKGDFLGFTFDNIHSSDLGIVRVSNNSRYSDNLIPNIQDKTVQVPGGDGSYYFKSFYTQRNISLDIVYDSLTDVQLRRLRQIFGDRKIHDLIFDEFPYKIYKVKTQNPPQLKYVVFDDETTGDFREGYITAFSTKDELYGHGVRTLQNRVYKGEGTLNFICYQPFARSRFKYLNEYEAGKIPAWGNLDTFSSEDLYYNLYEWGESSGLTTSNYRRQDGLIGSDPFYWYIDQPIEDNENNKHGVLTYNPGDEETDFILQFNQSQDTAPVQGVTVNAFNLTLEGKTDYKLEFTSFTLRDDDTGFQINTKLNLIQGLDSTGAVTGTIYNRYLVGGDFFRLPNDSTYRILNWNNSKGVLSNINIQYDYLYF